MRTVFSAVGDEFVLTSAKPGDIPAILALMKACEDVLPPLEEAGAAALLRRNIRRDSVLLAMLEGRIAGAAIWSPELRRISYLAVSPSCRRRGAASRLLSAVLKRMPAGDVTVETFRTGDPRGAAAHALYRRFGFREDAPLEGYDLPMQKYRLCR